MDLIDYKRADILSQFVQERGKILPRRMTGVCSRHQRWLGVAIKRARNIALLPFAGSAAHATAQLASRTARYRGVIDDRSPRIGAFSISHELCSAVSNRFSGA